MSKQLCREYGKQGRTCVYTFYKVMQITDKKVQVIVCNRAAVGTLLQKGQSEDRDQTIWYCNRPT